MKFRHSVIQGTHVKKSSELDVSALIFIAMSQVANLSYVTASHSSHDKCWLLQGVSNPLFCFACAVEGLESKDVLNVRKRGILIELLEVVPNTRPIWKVLTTRPGVHRHIMSICFKLLLHNIDMEFQQLVIESILLFAKKINQDSSFNFILDMLVSTPNFLCQSALVSLLSKFVESLPSAVESLFMKNNRIIEIVIKATSSCKVDLKAPLWHLLSNILKQSHEGFTLPSVAVKTLLQSSTDAFNDSTSSEALMLSLFAVFRSFIAVPQLQKMLLVHETSEFTPQSRSVVDIIKKMLLSKSAKLQTASIEMIICITEECAPTDSSMVTLSSILIEAGVSEYLFELFTCNKEETLELLFSCVKGLMKFPCFFKQGHLTYGVSPIIQSLKVLAEATSIATLKSGLELLTCLFHNLALQDLCFMGSSSAIVDVIDVLNKSLSVSNDQVKLAVAACFEKYLVHLKGCRKSELISTLFCMVENIFDFTSKAEKGSLSKQFKISLGLKSCLILSQIVRLIKKGDKESKAVPSSSEATDERPSSSKSIPDESQESQKNSDVVLGVFYLVDTCLIPIAVSSLLAAQNKDFNIAFYQMLLSVMELRSPEGEALAKKLAESHFIRFVTDFRIASRSIKGIQIDEVLSKLQFYFCLAMEDEDIKEEDQKHLLVCLSKFSVPLKEWKLLLIQSQSNDMGLLRSRSCILALLAYSLKSKDPLILADGLLICLQQLAANADLLNSLPVFSKRLFLYLWVNCEFASKATIQRNIHARENIVKLLVGQSKDLEKLYMHCDLNLPWVLRLNLPLNILVSYTKVYLSYLTRYSYEVMETKLSKAKHMIVVNGLANVALEVLVYVVSSEKEKMLMQISSHFLVELAESSSEGPWITFMKKTLHKVLLAESERMEPENMAALFAILNHNRFFSNANIATEDMKLFCRALALCNTAPLSELQLELVNFLYAILVISSQKGDSHPFSIFMNNVSICKDFERQVFLNKNLKAFVTGGNLIERIVSATVLLVNQALKTYHQFNMAELSTPAVKIDKSLLLDALCWFGLPLLQVSVVLLWASFFEVKCNTSFLSLVDASGVPCQVTENDVRMIFVALQNLLVNTSSLMSRAAAECFSALIRKVNNAEFVLRQPWNKSILKYSLSALCNEITRIASCTVVSCLLEQTFGDLQFTDILEKISFVITNDLTGFHLETLCPVIETFLSKCLTSMSESELSTFLKDLKALFAELMRRSLEENNKISIFDVMDGVLVHVRDSVPLINHQGSVQRSISLVKKRIEELEDIADKGA